MKPIPIVQIVGYMCVGWVAKGLLQPCVVVQQPQCAPCVCSYLDATLHPAYQPNAPQPRSACPACPACPPPASGIQTSPSTAPTARGQWVTLPPLPDADAGGAEGRFAAARAELRQCVNEMQIDLSGFQCVPNPPPRAIGGLLHMIPNMDPEMIATELAKSAPNSLHPTVFIDVGTNDGKAIRKIMQTHHVQIFGFEPNPGQLDGLIREVATNPDLRQRVHLFPAAVGKEEGKLTLNYGKFDNAGSSFAYGGNTDVDANRYEQTEVDVVTLDEKVLPLVDPESMIVLKIDTQGWEMDVLRGASELLRTRRVRYIIAELAPYILCGRGVNPYEILETLNCMGFHCSDSTWMPTRSPSKYAKQCDGVSNQLGAGCGMTSDTEQDFNTWVDSTHGYTDIVCERVSGPMVRGGGMFTAQQTSQGGVTTVSPGQGATCPPCICQPCPATAATPFAVPPSAVGSTPTLPRGVVHGLMSKLQLDDPYVVTAGVAPSLCIDVGAHLGWTVEQVAVHGHRVYAFEPFAGNHAALRKAVEPYPGVRIFEGAVSDVAGEVSFGEGSTVAKTAEGAGEYAKTAFRGTSSNNHITKNGRGKTVRSYRLDDEVGDTEAVLFLKIDVQGHEMNVLKGAEKLLRDPARRPKYILAEFLSSQTIQLIEYLEEREYFCFDMSIAINKDTQDFSFKGQKAVFNKQIRTTTGLYTSEQFVKNRASSPLSAWKQDYVEAGFTQTDLFCVPFVDLLNT